MRGHAEVRPQAHPRPVVDGKQPRALGLSPRVQRSAAPHTTFADFMADRVAQLERELRLAKYDLHDERRRCDMWKARALGRTKNSEAAASIRSPDGATTSPTRKANRNG